MRKERVLLCINNNINVLKFTQEKVIFLILNRNM